MHGLPAQSAARRVARGVVEVALALRSAAGLALALVAIVLVIRRARAASAFQRRAFEPLAIAAAVLLALIIVSASAQALGLSDGVQKATQLVFIAGFALLPAAFLAGLLRSRFFRTAAVGGLIERLALGLGEEPLEQALAAALDDPTLAVAFWLPGARRVRRSRRPYARVSGHRDA